LSQAAANPWTLPVATFRLGVEALARAAEAVGAAAGQGMDEMVSRTVQDLRSGPALPWALALGPFAPLAAPLLLLAPLASAACRMAEAAMSSATAGLGRAAGEEAESEEHAGEEEGGLPLAGLGAPPGGLRDDRVKLVRFTLLSLRREQERILRRGETLVTESLGDRDFDAWAIGQYLDAHDLPPDEGRFLRVHYEVAARYDREPFDFPQRQVAALEEIREALLAGPPRPAAAPQPNPAPAAGAKPPAASTAPPPEPIAPADEEKDHG
jgi:hypothetical protein